MKTLLLLLFTTLTAIAQLQVQITNAGPDIIVQAAESPAGPWFTVHQEAATNQARFFRAGSNSNLTTLAVVTNRMTNEFKIRTGSNSNPTRVTLIALTDEPFPSNPTFMVRQGQARFDHPDTGSNISNGEFDSQYGCTVLMFVQDPITTPLQIRFLGQDAMTNRYEAHFIFKNP